MTFIAWLVVWIVLFATGIALVYWTGVRIERCLPSAAVVYFVVLGATIPVASWVAARYIVQVEQASCEELDPSSDRLNGATPSEFRTRCIATQDNSKWLSRRQRALTNLF